MKSLNLFAGIGGLAVVMMLYSMWWPAYIGKVIEEKNTEIGQQMKDLIPGSKTAMVVRTWDTAEHVYTLRVVINGAGNATPSENEVADAYFNAVRVSKPLWFYSKMNSPVFRTIWK